jgi:hypothetical protein
VYDSPDGEAHRILLPISAPVAVPDHPPAGGKAASSDGLSCAAAAGEGSRGPPPTGAPRLRATLVSWYETVASRT